jgi:enamine deaminase RidA (YjgF/YER057c/UK114 family)
MATALAAMLLAGSVSAHDEPVSYYNKGNDPSRPFSLAVRAGDTVYLAGQLGISADGKLPQGMEAQARQAMDNIAGVLKGMDLSMDNVVKCTVMLADMAKWGDFNKVYVGYFKPGHMPARAVPSAPTAWPWAPMSKWSASPTHRINIKETS